MKLFNLNIKNPELFIKNAILFLAVAVTCAVFSTTFTNGDRIAFYEKGCALTAVEIRGDKALKAKVEDSCVDAFTKIEYDNFARNFVLNTLFYWLLMLSGEGGGFKGNKKRK